VVVVCTVSYVYCLLPSRDMIPPRTNLSHAYRLLITRSLNPQWEETHDFMIYDRGAQEIEIEVRLVTDIVRWVGAYICLAQPPFHAACSLGCSQRKWFAQKWLVLN
jgi:hypothetical protein